MYPPAFNGSNSTISTATAMVGRSGSPVNPIETKNPTSSSSLMWNSERASSDDAGWDASSTPMMSAPRSPLSPTAVNNAYPGTSAMTMPNSDCISPCPRRLQTLRSIRVSGHRPTRASAHGLGRCPLVAVRNTTATMSCMTRMPMATRP